MTTPDVTITIGVENVSNYVRDVDIRKDKSTGIGSCTLVINNDGDTWGDTFSPNDAVEVAINGQLMFSGCVDNVMPILDNKGVLMNWMTVTSRDDGRVLTDLYVTTDKFIDEESGYIIDEILSEAGDPLTYFDPGGTPTTTYQCKRSYLSDAIVEIAERVGYDFYIDTTGELHFFPAGTVDSTVDLLSVPGGGSNNLLDFEEYEQIGTDIYNSIEVHAGSVKDHWTNGNAGDWVTLLGDASVMTDYTVTWMSGGASIAVALGGLNQTVGIDFSDGKYSQGGTLDLRELGQASVSVIPELGVAGTFSFEPTLIDATGKMIRFYRTSGGSGSKGFTTNLDASLFSWRVINFPLGEHVGNPITATPQNGKWYGDTDFDWENVKKIGFKIEKSVIATLSNVYIDLLYIPTIEARSIREDSGVGSSIALYGKRMYSEYRKDLTTQAELDEYAEKLLELKKDPVKKFKATAVGQTGTKYAAQSVDVQAPGYGIPALTDYIIVSLHHKLHYEKDERGWMFTTEYDLAESGVDATRIIYTDDPVAKRLQRLREENRKFKGSIEADEYWLADIMTGLYIDARTGAAFPTDINDGDIFFLTADYHDGAKQYYGPAQYKYDTALGYWIRDPMVMYRAAQPPAGGAMTGDIYYNTVTGIIYQWTGAAWLKIGIKYISDAVDFGTVEWPTDQLAIETRPWTSNLSIVWDEATPDWNKILWGTIGNEGNSPAGDATIRFADGTTRTIVASSNDDVADGDWYVYWTTANTTLQWDTNYAVAVGENKGLMAIVRVNNAATEPPTILMFNSYSPIIGAGAIAAYSIWSKHISADWITGKNFRTAAAGARVEFNSSGIRGYNATPAKTFDLDATDGKISVLGDGSFNLKTIGGTLVGSFEVDDAFGTMFAINAALNKDFYITAGDTEIQIPYDGILGLKGKNNVVIYTDGGGGNILIYNGDVLDLSDGGVNPGRFVLPIDTSDPGAPKTGEVWFRTDL